MRLLKPRPADERVGRRDIDVQVPGSNMAGHHRPRAGRRAQARRRAARPAQRRGRAGARTVGAAGTSRTRTSSRPTWRAFVDLADDYARLAADAANQASDIDAAITADPDPLITPPLYGRWHALTPRILTDEDGDDLPNNRNWVHELNLDPRWRSAAGFGTDVIVSQPGGLHGRGLGPGRRRARGQPPDPPRSARHADVGDLVLEASGRRCEPRETGGWLAIDGARPATRDQRRRHRVPSGPPERGDACRDLDPAAPDGAAQRPHRSHSGASTATSRRRRSSTASTPATVTAAPPNTVPPGLPTVEDVAEEMHPDGAAGTVLDWLRRWPWLRFDPARARRADRAARRDPARGRRRRSRW